MTEKLMSTDEVANYLHVHYKTVANLVERGDLKAHRVGRVWRYRKSDVDAYLEKGTYVPGQKFEEEKEVKESV